MKQLLVTFFFSLIFNFGLVGQYHFTTSVNVQGNKTIVIEMVTTGIEIMNAGTPPYNCTYGYNFNVLFDYSIKSYNQNGSETGFNQIYTLQGKFLCDNQSTFFNLPNNLGEGSGKTVGNIWVGEPTCNSATVESLICNQIEFEIKMKGYTGDQFITVPGTSFLPIELITFDAYKKDRQVELLWKTATETNNDFFTIERSVDGKYWESIQTISGAGNSVKVLDYSWTDNSPYAGVSYYRLNQTDYDGTTKSFHIISVEQDGLELLQAYPNPVIHTVTLLGVNEDQPVRIFNTIGVEMTKNANISLSPSKKTLVNMSDLPKGIYYISNGEKPVQVVKQ